MKKLLLLFYSLLFFILKTQSQAGAIDPSFGNSGYILSQLKGDPFRNIALQADGKIILAGTAYTGENSVEIFHITRFNSDGSPDFSFGQAGLITENFGNSELAVPNDIAIQPDGKIIVAGTAFFDFNSQFVIARYNADGSLDYNFAGDGTLMMDIAYGSKNLNSITIQPDGKIIVVGGAYFDLTYQLFIARFNADGSLDMGFDGDGLLHSNLSILTEGISTKLQPDGKIVVCALGLFANTGYDFIIARYNSDGSLDLNFDGDGFRIIDFGSNYDFPNAIEIQSDGKIIVAGESSLQDYNDFAIARCNVDGSLDLSFDNDGLLTTDFQDRDEALSVSLRIDGKIIVAGESAGQLAIAKYNSNGSLDLSFDEDGKVVSDFAIPFGGSYGAIDCIVFNEKRIYAGGYRFAEYGLGGGYGTAAAYYEDYVCSTSVTISDAYAVTPGGSANTIYLGYGPSSLTITAHATGGDPNYSYSWSNGQTGSSTAVSPNTIGTHIYSVTVTDATGCTSSATKTIIVVDIRTPGKPGKVNICHRDLKGKWTTLSVLAGSVAEHLAHGDYLGQCVTTTTSTEAEIITKAVNQISNESESIAHGIRLFPNPASNYLNIEWSIKTSASTSISIKDLQGRVIKKVQAGLIQQNTINRRTISLVGLAKGVYILELRTGADIQVSKFVIQ